MFKLTSNTDIHTGHDARNLPSGPASQNSTVARFTGNVQRHKALTIKASIREMCKRSQHTITECPKSLQSRIAHQETCKEASCENRFGLLMFQAAADNPSKHCNISDRRPKLNGPSVLSTALNECCTRHSVAHPPNSHHSIALDRASCCCYFSC